MPDIQFLLIQALGLIPSVISIAALQSGDRKKILLLQLGCCVLWAVHYGLLGAMTAVLINGVGFLRAVLCYFNDRAWAKSKFWLFALLAMYAACAALTWDGLYCVLPCVSMMLTTVALWGRDMRRTRLLFLLNSPPLLAYNIITGSYSCAAIEFIALLSFALAIYRFDIRGRRAEGTA